MQRPALEGSGERKIREEEAENVEPRENDTRCRETLCFAS